MNGKEPAPNAKPVFDPETATIPRDGSRIVFAEAQGSYFRLNVRRRELTPEASSKRGRIREFSASSRKRMIDEIARIDMAKAGYCCFITLTYPDELGPPSWERVNRDREAFTKRLHRYSATSSGIWRREWERRKSGLYIGAAFPHLHLLAFNQPFLPHEEVNRWWWEITGVSVKPRTEIEGITEKRRALYYVSKYMAKLPEDGEEFGASAGKRDAAGASPAATASPAGAPGGEAACSLVNGAYSAATNEDAASAPMSIGRLWGVWNKKHFPYAERRAVRLGKPGPWLDTLKDEARQHWEGVSDHPELGFTLYLDTAPEFLKHAVELSKEGGSGDAS